MAAPASAISWQAAPALNYTNALRLAGTILDYERTIWNHLVIKVMNYTNNEAEKMSSDTGDIGVF